MAEELSYADALTELDDILNELEAVDVDVDRLAERVLSLIHISEPTRPY